MKKNLFLLVVGLLSSLMSFAQPEGWNDPTGTLTKTTTIIADGSTVYYLKNEAVENWFIASNEWGTQACVSAKDLAGTETPYGYKIRFKDTTTHEGFYQIEDAKENSFKYLFDNAGTIYTDYNNQGIDKTYWKFTFDGDNNCTFVSYMNQNKNVGLVSGGDNPATGSKGDYTINNAGTEVATTWSLWSMGAPEAVAEWNAANALMTRMQEIYEESQEKFDVAPYASQIGEQLGTVENAERLNALIAQMNADYLIWKFNEGGKVAVEVALENPGFETGNMSGWSALSGTSLYGAQGNKSFDRVVGNYYAEFWHKNGDWSASQTIKSLPAGMYKLSANVYSSNGKAKLFVNDKETDFIEVSNRYSLMYEATSLGDITIGIKSSDTGNAWNCVDDFSFKYLGFGADGYANTFDVNYEGKASPQYVKGLADKVAAIRVAEGDEAIQAAYNTAKEYEDSVVAKNIAAWAKYEAILVDAQTLAEDPQFADYSATLAGMVQQRYVMENDPTTAELNAEYDAVVAEMNNVKSHIQPGTDITDTYLKNAYFTQDIVGINTGDPTKGWRIDGTKGGGNWRISTGDKCGECWNGNDFDFYQIVENAPVGVYQIEVQGFTRAKRGNDSWNCYFDSTTGELLPTPIFGDWTPNKANVYLNDNTGDLSISYAYPHAVEEKFYDGVTTDLYTDPLGKYEYPNTMAQGGRAFGAGEYKVSAFGLVAKEGDPLRIGVKGNNYGLDNWCIFTNFKLTYQGFQADIIEPEFNKAVEALATAHIGTELQAELLDLKERADAVSRTQGKAMFDILSEIYAFNTKKASSEEVFADLNKQTKDLEDAIQQYKETATEEALKAARKLDGTASDAYEDEETLLPTVTTDEAKAITSQIAQAIEALKIPKEAGSDDDPVDFTSVIKNANMSSATGWTVEEGSMSIDDSKVAEFYNQENYNVYQKLTNLPAGVYELKVQGFYRAGSVANDWTVLVDSVPSAAVLYTINQSEGYDPEVFECPLRHLTAEAVNEDPGFGNMVTFTPFAELGDETKWYVPNMRSSVSQFFDAGDYYVNSIYFAIYSPTDTTTIGIKKHGPVNDTDWCPFDNWTLTGYGFESAKWDYLGAQTNSCDPVAPVFDPSAAIIKGDANGDREVNITDVSYVLDDINGVENEGFNKEAADVNGDGEINITDVSLILDIINGVEPNAEPEN